MERKYMTDYSKKIGESILHWKSDSNSYEDYLREKFSMYKYICVFGLGNIGLPTIQVLSEKRIKIDFLCDNDEAKWGKKFYDIECISPEMLKKYKEDTLVIICGRAFKEIYRQLADNGFLHLYRIHINKFAVYDYFNNNNLEDIFHSMEKVLDICADEESKRIYVKIVEEWLERDYTYGGLDSICTDNQYFCDDLFLIPKDEIFVDAGAYNGDTLRTFLDKVGNDFEKYYCFELAQSNYKRLKSYISGLGEEEKNKIVAINKGVSNCREEILYSDSDEGSQIDERGTVKGFVTSIDAEIVGRISYIKMDIEGSELKALEGAKESIKQYRPKLAVCLYHKPQDMWEIPLYIKSLVPEYKIYIRHHTDLLNETVCYALA